MCHAPQESTRNSKPETRNYPRHHMSTDLLHEAYGAMKHNRRRALLTMLGMGWGIATVILLMAYGAGFGTAIENIFDSFGSKVIGVFPGVSTQQAGGAKAGV